MRASVLLSLSLVCAAAGCRASTDLRFSGDGGVVLSISDVAWELELPSGEYETTIRDDRRRYYVLHDRSTSLNISLILHPARGDSRSCRDRDQRRLERNFPNRKGVTQGQIDRIHTLEYMDSGSMGFLRMQHFWAHLVRDGHWIQVHLSMTNYEPKHRKRFVRFVRGLKFRKRQR